MLLIIGVVLLFDFSSRSLADYADRVNHQRLCWPALDDKGLAVYLRRDDIASEHYPGNKFYKLFYNIRSILEAGHKTVVSFGGAYSNHIHALAAMGEQYGLSTVGIIRGYPPKSPEKLSPTLQDAQACGMRLLFLNKQDYQCKNISTFEALLNTEYGHYYLLPEGGENLLGVKGCQAIGQSISEHFTGDYTVCCAVGTGTTLSGIISGLPENMPVIGFSALKGEDSLSSTVSQWLDKVDCQHVNWQVINDYHHGGYAKVNPQLLQFMAELEEANGLQLEPVYNAKMLWGIEQLALQGYWPAGSRIVVVHGGGVQGRRGFGL